VGTCKQITILIIFEASSRFETLLKFINSFIYVANILVITVCCKLINFVCQILPCFISEMPAAFTSYIVQIIPIYLAL
jgi:hypothetical protein